jgi:hypothetical protein
MPIWTVKLRIVVPGLGSRLVDFPGMTAASIEEAIGKARAVVIVEPVQAEQTAP